MALRTRTKSSLLGFKKALAGERYPFLLNRHMRSITGASMQDPIVLENLTKDYGKGFKAVDVLNLTVKRNSFVGFLGPNGAGKTTTIKMLTNLLTITSGKAYLNGVD